MSLADDFQYLIDLEEKVRCTNGESDGDEDGFYDDLEGGKPCVPAPDAPNSGGPEGGGLGPSIRDISRQGSSKPNKPVRETGNSKTSSKLKARTDEEQDEILADLPYELGKNGETKGPKVPTGEEILNGGNLFQDEGGSYYDGPDFETRDELLDKYYSDKDIAKALEKAYTQEVEETFDRTFNDRRPATAVVPEAIFGLLRDGRMKSGFETPALTVDFSKKRRTEFESINMGVPSDIDPQKRPIYGFMESLDPDLAEEDREDIGDMYGTNIIYLNDNVKRRSTTSRSDSLADETYPIKFGDNELTLKQKQNALGLGVTRNLLERAQKRALGMDTEELDGDYRLQISHVWNEIQVHGGIDISDIARIGLDRDGDQYEELTRALDEAGIEYFDL
jgi:hypothetical protein